MTRNAFLILASIVYLLFGLGLLLVPATMASIFGTTLNPGGLMAARLLGSALIAFALIYWWIKDAAPVDPVLAVLQGSCVYNIIDIFIAVQSTVTGVMGAMGWAAAALHVVLAVGFGYFGFIKR